MLRGLLVRCVVFLLSLLCLLPSTSVADDQSDYDQAVIQAQVDALDPSHWSVSDLRVITGPGSGDGNTYVDGALVAATFTKQSYFWSAYAGKAMTVYGSPATSATWVTIGGELQSYLLASGVTADAVHLETSRALGMSGTNTNDTIVEMLVAPDINSIQRPTRDPSIAAQPTSCGTNAPFVRPDGVSDTVWANFQAYYADWLAQAYGSAHFPWTQFGYTYRWGRGDTLADIRGLSEFIVPGGTAYTILAMYSLQSYLYTTGNGSGDFTVTGPLDSLWAGRMFQPVGSYAVIQPGATVSGGQGILVSSQGFTLTNAGTVTGPTTTKFGLAGTDNVAVLFLGRVTSEEPAGTGNFLTNIGVIESPGTAVRAEAGDLRINNSGRIVGGDFAVLTGAGNDSIFMTGGELRGRVDLGDGQDSLMVVGPGVLGFPIDTAQPVAPIQHVEYLGLFAGASLDLTFSASDYARTGQTFTIADATALNISSGGVAVTSNLPMVRFATRVNGNTLNVVATRDTAWYARHLANRSLGASLDAMASRDTPIMAGLIGSLDTSANPAAAATCLAPAGQARTTVLARDAASAFSGAFAARRGQLRGESGGSGLAPAGFSAREATVVDALSLARRDQATGGSGLAASPWLAAVPEVRGRDPLAGPEVPIEVFGSVYGAGSRGQASQGAPGYATDATGVLAGVGVRVAPGLRLGLVGGYAFADTWFDNGAGRSKDSVWRLGPYAAFESGPWSVDALLTYGGHQVQAERPVPLVGATATSDAPMDDILGYASVARRFDLGSDTRLIPFLDAQYLWLGRQAVSESGAGAANLRLPYAASASLTSLLGLRLERTFEWATVAVRPTVWAGWRHEYADAAPSVRAAFASVPGSDFATSGGRADRDQARGGAAVTLSGRTGQAVQARFEGGLGGTRSDMAVSLGLRLTF